MRRHICQYKDMGQSYGKEQYVCMFCGKHSTSANEISDRAILIMLFNELQDLKDDTQELKDKCVALAGIIYER